jgi:excisionase family DNA binding protein
MIRGVTAAHTTPRPRRRSRRGDRPSGRDQRRDSGPGVELQEDAVDAEAPHGSRLLVTLTVAELDARIERAVAKALAANPVAPEPVRVSSAAPIHYSRAEAAVIVGVSKRTIDRAISTGELSTARRGRRRLIPGDQLERWMTGMQVGA